MPVDVQWCSPGLAHWRQRLMVRSMPVTFWVVGEVNRRGAWFESASGQHYPIVSMNVTPSRIGDAVLWDAFLDSLGGIIRAF